MNALLGRPEVRLYLPHAIHLADDHQRRQVGACRQVKASPHRPVERLHRPAARLPHVRRHERRFSADTLIQQKIAGAVLHAGHALRLRQLLAQIVPVAEHAQRGIGRFPRRFIHQLAARRRGVKVADDPGIVAGLGIVNPDRQQISVRCRLRADGDQQRFRMGPLAGGDGVHKVRLRPAHLAHFVKDAQHRRQAVRRLAVSGQCLVFGIERQADQALSRWDDPHQLRQLGRQPHHVGCQLEHQRSLVAAHGTGHQLAIQLGFRPDKVRQ